MSDDLELLPDREREHVRSRDRKVRGPNVVVDNPGLKKLADDIEANLFADVVLNQHEDGTTQRTNMGGLGRLLDLN